MVMRVCSGKHGMEAMDTEASKRRWQQEMKARENRSRRFQSETGMEVSTNLSGYVM